MKLLFLIVVFYTTSLFAQQTTYSLLKIGDKATILPSAILELKSTTAGMLLPRMTTSQKNAISNPATGLLVFDTTLNTMSAYNGASWITLSGTVTSVGLSDTSSNPIYTTGSPVTTSGNLTFALSTQTKNTIFSGPSSGANAQPTFRSLVGADIPLTIGALDGQAVNSTGLAYSSGTLYGQSADGTHPGMVNTTTQTMAGAKTFSTSATSPIFNATTEYDLGGSTFLTASSANHWTILGLGAGAGNTGTWNTAVGYQAMGGGALAGNLNVAVGGQALNAISAGSNNTSLGTSSCAGVSTQNNNTCLGFQTDIANSAQSATAIGYNAVIGVSGGIMLGSSGVQVGIGGVNTFIPTASLHLPAGTATAHTAPLKITSGTNLTAAEAGAIENDGVNLWYTKDTPTREMLLYAPSITQYGVLYGSTTTAIASTAAGTSGYLLTSNNSSAPTYQQLNLGTSAAVTGTLPILNGGTGQTTKQAAMDGLSPQSAKGDLAVYSGSHVVAQAVGSNGQVLTADSTQTNGLKWAAGGGGGTGINFVGLSTAWAVSSPDDITGDASVGNWLAFKNTASATPGSLTGGSPTTTCLQTTTAGHILDGAGSLEWVVDAANRQGEGCSVLVNIPPGYRGQNAMFQMSFNVLSGTFVAADILMAVYDVTNSALLATSGSSIQGSGLLKANLVIPSSTTQVRIGLYRAVTTAAAVTIDFDDIILGPATNLGTGIIGNDWIAYTPTYTGFGTVTSNSAYYKRIGDTLEVMASFTSGTVAGSIASATLPTGLTIDTTKISIQNTTSNSGPVVGFYQNNGANNIGAVLTATGTSTSVVYFAPSALNTTPANGSSVDNNTEAASFFFRIPISQWSSTGTTITTSQVANMWSGYHDNTCSWARTNTSYGDPTADASCNLVQRVNNNFGTVSSYAGLLPGIIFTPSRLGTYHVCAHFQLAGSGLAATVAARLWDGTTTVAEVDDTQQVATDAGQLSLCGLYTSTSLSATTLSIQTKSSTGSATLAAAGTSASSIEWEIFQADQNFPHPYFVGGVASPSTTGVEYVGRAQVTVSNSAAAVVSQNGSWLSVANGASAGLTTGTMTGFSAAPACTCTVIGAATTSASHCIFTAEPTSTSILFSRNRAGAAESGDVNVICVGPH